MSAPIPILVLLAVFLFFPLVYALTIYNRLVKLRAHLRESWAGVEVELQRRYELIPNLVEVCTGYAKHERETLERVVELRNTALANIGSPTSQSGDEMALNAGLRSLFAVAESYPDLKADALFINLQNELANTEDRIAATRRFYNGNVRELNTLILQFPSSIIARVAKFTEADYFALKDEEMRSAPRVDINDAHDR